MLAGAGKAHELFQEPLVLANDCVRGHAVRGEIGLNAGTDLNSPRMTCPPIPSSSGWCPRRQLRR